MHVKDYRFVPNVISGGRQSSHVATHTDGQSSNSSSAKRRYKDKDLAKEGWHRFVSILDIGVTDTCPRKSISSSFSLTSGAETTTCQYYG